MVVDHAHVYCQNVLYEILFGQIVATIELSKIKNKIHGYINQSQRVVSIKH